MGWKTEAIISAMPGMLSLAAAGALDLGRAADITSDTMQAFGISSKNATHVADVFAYAQANANTNVEQLGDAMTYLAPVANALGWELEASAAGIMAVSDAGIKGGMAGQAFATSLARLAKPTKAMNKEMSRLGINLFTSDGRLKNLPDVIGELETATKGMTKQQKSSTLSTMFGAQAYKHWAVLLERGSDELSRMEGELKLADGAAADMAATMIDNLGGAWAIFMSGVAEAAYSIYEKFEPAMRIAVDWLTVMVGKVPAAVDALIKFSKPFVPMAKAIGIAVLAVGAFLAVVGTFKLIGAALLFLVSPIGLVIGGITALVLGFQAAYKHSEPFRKAVDGIVGSVKGLFKLMTGDRLGAFGDMFESGLTMEQALAVDAFAGKLKDGFAKVKTVFAGFKTMFTGGGATDLLTTLGFSPELIGSITAFVGTIQTTVARFVETLKAKWAEIQPSIMMLLGHFASLKDTAISIFTTLLSALQPVFGALGTAFNIIADIAVMAFNSIIAPAIRFVITMFKTLWIVVGPILQLIGALIGTTFAILQVIWDTILKPFASWILGAFVTTFEAMQKQLATASDSFSWLGDKISGVVDWFGKITSAVKNFKVPNWLSKLGGGGTVKFEETSVDGSHFHGIARVPKNNYSALLHKGESVLTRQQTDAYEGVDYASASANVSNDNRSYNYSDVTQATEGVQGGGYGGISISGNTFHVRQESDIDDIADQLFRKMHAASEGGA